jgi:hypothetical protein
MRVSRITAFYVTLIATMVATIIGPVARAQTTTSVTSLPRVQFTDKNGVDLKSGQYAPPFTKISIGPIDAPVLTFDWMPFFDASLSSGTPMVG